MHSGLNNENSTNATSKNNNPCEMHQDRKINANNLKGCEASMAGTNEQKLQTFFITKITTTNVGNFQLYRGQVYVRGQDGKIKVLSDFINTMRGFETVTVDNQKGQGKGMHFGDIVGSKFPRIDNPCIVKEKMKKFLVEELIKQDYVSIDGKTTYRFVIAAS